VSVISTTDVIRFYKSRANVTNFKLSYFKSTNLCEGKGLKIISVKVIYFFDNLLIWLIVDILVNDFVCSHFLQVFVSAQ